VGLAHLHAPAVSVREQAGVLAERLKNGKPMSFRVLTEDAENTLTVVARFLALLEMFRDAVINFDQVSPLGELTVRWSSGDDSWSSEGISAEFDDEPVPQRVEDQ
jgi:segregation and condensation protein A